MCEKNKTLIDELKELGDSKEGRTNKIEAITKWAQANPGFIVLIVLFICYLGSGIYLLRSSGIFALLTSDSDRLELCERISLAILIVSGFSFLFLPSIANWLAMKKWSFTARARLEKKRLASIEDAMKNLTRVENSVKLSSDERVRVLLRRTYPSLGAIRDLVLSFIAVIISIVALLISLAEDDLKTGQPALGAVLFFVFMIVPPICYAVGEKIANLDLDKKRETFEILTEKYAKMAVETESENTESGEKD
ncbi:Uncharacterised protein [Trueperella bialowiezensis]|uniref:Uncharacterized protein n=2 Tax=Trueperella bialowiezensis TaxID=312285 RepID=A0A3S5EW66_9ACTO|nr:Uncharacterised protein [Trueperella bialowiezensis]